LGTATGDQALIGSVRAHWVKIGGVFACAGILSSGLITASVNYSGARATLEGSRPLLTLAQPRAVTIAQEVALWPGS
jgi:hypothetical protein